MCRSADRPGIMDFRAESDGSANCSTAAGHEIRERVRKRENRRKKFRY